MALTDSAALPMSSEPISILFVCLGNICRSPALAATLHHFALEKNCSDYLRIDSCGLNWLHVGEHPDPRSFAAAKKRGIMIDHQAQQFRDHFFDEFDMIFAVDREVVDQIHYHARSEKEKKKVYLATAFSKRFKDQDIPDPYYLSSSGFDDVMEMVLDSCKGLLDHLLNVNFKPL